MLTGIVGYGAVPFHVSGVSGLFRDYPVPSKVVKMGRATPAVMPIETGSRRAMALGLGFGVSPG